MPVEYMLKILNDEKQPTDRRDWAAVQAAPYLHHKLASIEVTTSQEGASAHDMDLSLLTDNELNQLESLVRKTVKPSPLKQVTLDNVQYHEVPLEESD